LNNEAFINPNSQVIQCKVSEKKCVFLGFGRFFEN
jgi:hypothetical protein